MRRLLPALLVSVALAACGADDEPAAGPPEDSTRLTVEVTGAGPEPITVELRCGAGESCARSQLDALAAIAAPDDSSTACTQQYGGPEKAHMTGTLEGRRVDVTVARSNGCGIADYEALFAALGREQPLGG